MNGNYKGDDTVGRLMHDFGCKEAKEMYYPELAKGVKHFKEEGGRERMCEAVEKYAENTRLNSLLESIKNLMDSMNIIGTMICQKHCQFILAYMQENFK